MTVNVPEAIAAVFLTLIVYANASPTWTAVVEVVLVTLRLAPTRRIVSLTVPVWLM